jgi:hypothetical protein
MTELLATSHATDDPGFEQRPPTAPQRAQRESARSAARTQRFRLGVLIAVGLIVAIVLWLALRPGNDSSSSSVTSNVSAATVAQLQRLATSLDHPVFWLGRKSGYRYELTRQSNGNVYIRYLPPGVKIGDTKGYLTVATYPFVGAYTAIKAVAKQKGVTPLRVAGGGLGEISATSPESVHVAYPNVDYQIEVYDPTPGSATAMVASGQLQALGGLTSGSNTPVAMSVKGLGTLARSLGHPIYWAGPKPGYTYEVTRGSGGQVYLRYLPPGVTVGSPKAFLTVATYPFPRALQALEALTSQKGVTPIPLPDGGLGLRYSSYRKSIHLAYPGSSYQVEVFSDSPARVLRLVKSGRVGTIG